jgi:hypothetical protein
VPANYEKITQENLARIYSNPPEDLGARLPALKRGELFSFKAFGEDCCLGPEGITLSGKPLMGPRALLISLYATRSSPEALQLKPFRSFKDLPGSMPYWGAFSANAEQVLVPQVPRIRMAQEYIRDVFSGGRGPGEKSGDFSLVLYPLPKIALCYIFYLPDEEFPASVTCLFSANALSFMPLDGLADVAEYTSKAIIQISA